MDVIEQLENRLAADPYVGIFKAAIVHAARQELTSAGLDPTDARAESWVEEFRKRCVEIFTNQALLAEAAVLGQNLRRLALQPERRQPSELEGIAAREGLYRMAGEWGWASLEGDALLIRANGDPGRVSELNWRGAKVDGVFVSREELRQSLRTAAYSDSGWSKFLATNFPAVRAPEGPR